MLWGRGASPRGHPSGLGPLVPTGPLVAVGTAERCKLRIFSVFHCSLPLNLRFPPSGAALASFPQPRIPPCPAAAMGCAGLGGARSRGPFALPSRRLPGWGGMLLEANPCRDFNFLKLLRTTSSRDLCRF